MLELISGINSYNYSLWNTNNFYFSHESTKDQEALRLINYLDKDPSKIIDILMQPSVSCTDLTVGIWNYKIAIDTTNPQVEAIINKIDEALNNRKIILYHSRANYKTMDNSHYFDITFESTSDSAYTVCNNYGFSNSKTWIGNVSLILTPPKQFNFFCLTFFCNTNNCY